MTDEERCETQHRLVANIRAADISRVSPDDPAFWAALALVARSPAILDAICQVAQVHLLEDACAAQVPAAPVDDVPTP